MFWSFKRGMDDSVEATTLCIRTYSGGSGGASYDFRKCYGRDSPAGWLGGVLVLAMIYIVTYCRAQQRRSLATD